MKKEYANSIKEYRSFTESMPKENISLPKEYFETGAEVYRQTAEFSGLTHGELKDDRQKASAQRSIKHHKKLRKMVYAFAAACSVLVISQTLIPLDAISQDAQPSNLQTIVISAEGKITREFVNSQMSQYELQEEYKIIVQGNVTEIGESAFEDCDNLYSVELPDTVSRIGKYAFLNCEKLVSADLPDAKLYVCNNAFTNCYNLVFESIDTAKIEAEGHAFANTTVKNLIISESAVCRYKDPYLGVTVENIVFEEGITRIPDSILSSTHGYSSLTLPETVKVIGNGVFSGCNELKSIILPDGLTTIMEGAFYSCSSLEEVFIPDDAEIGHHAFGYCTNVLLSVKEGSQAMEYAQKENIPYIAR
ncbi:MAG: leucine-rich repeat domain-containing protein [Firmicutes bacterium]|nr:leucine-rich repeat domain-containing protein [Bacillota bacterium]